MSLAPDSETASNIGLQPVKGTVKGTIVRVEASAGFWFIGSCRPFLGLDSPDEPCFARDLCATMAREDARPSKNDLGNSPSRQARKNVGTMPSGRQILDGVEFDLRGIIQESVRLSEYPSAPPFIPFKHNCQKLHFLHAATGIATNGAQIGTYSVRYGDGPVRRIAIPIIYGDDLLNWRHDPAQTNRPTRASVAWTGRDSRGDGLSLFKTTWTNPHPEVAIWSISFSVTAANKVTPFLVSITAE